MHYKIKSEAEALALHAGVASNLFFGATQAVLDLTGLTAEGLDRICGRVEADWIANHGDDDEMGKWNLCLKTADAILAVI